MSSVAQQSSPPASGNAPLPPPARKLKFGSEDEVLAEIARLRLGYKQHGHWSLRQIAWHLAYPMEKYLTPPESPDVKPTPEQAKLKAAFIDPIIRGEPLPVAFKVAPPTMIPPAGAGDADIDRLAEQFRRLKNYQHSIVMMGPMGPVPIEECRKLQFAHAAHHLAFLEPTSGARREGLTFNSINDVIADVQRLRLGYTKTGSWTLPQVCWHLETATRLRMAPGPHAPDTPEQIERKQRIPQILSSGRLPDGIEAPAPAIPPPNVDDSAIEALIASLKKWDSYAGEIAPHRLFGHLATDEIRKLNLIHCAHHLSYLVPTKKAKE